jgi:hypothetical protein
MRIGILTLALLLGAAGALVPAAANDANYIFSVRNATADGLTFAMLDIDCVTIGMRFGSLAPGETRMLRFYRSGDCRGRQGTFTLKVMGSGLAAYQDRQGFTFDAAGGLAMAGPEPSGFRGKLSGMMRRDADSVAYDFIVRPPFVPIAQVYARLLAKVGRPATTDPARFARRADLGVPDDQALVLDIGGEGEHFVGNVHAGFREAINFNDKDVDSQPPRGPIPFLIRLNDWSTSPPLPIADGIGNYVVMQNAPLYDAYVPQIARITAVGGQIGLWIDKDLYAGQIARLAQLVGGIPTYSGPMGSDCQDEFGGHGGYDKVCITRWK